MCFLPLKVLKTARGEMKLRLGADRQVFTVTPQSDGTLSGENYSPSKSSKATKETKLGLVFFMENTENDVRAAGPIKEAPLAWWALGRPRGTT